MQKRKSEGLFPGMPVPCTRIDHIFISILPIKHHRVINEANFLMAVPTGRLPRPDGDEALSDFIQSADLQTLFGMVGFNPSKDHNLSKVQYATAGAISGIVTRCAAQPLDVVKIRFQLQVAGPSEAKYRGIFQCVGRITKDEGARALWKGHLPAQALSITYGAFQFLTFEMLTKTVWYYLPEKFTTDLKPFTHFACGGAAGCVASIISQPFDVLRTRLIAQGEPKIYQSMLHAMRSILHQEGPTAFYKGLSATLIQIAPYSGLQFGFYAMYNRLWDLTTHRKEGQNIGMVQSFLCGGAAGMCAKAGIYPLDFVKKRLQVQGFEGGWSNIGETRTYNGLIHCLKQVAKEEGARGFFKGLSPSLVKAVFTAGANFCVYEQCCNILSSKGS